MSHLLRLRKNSQKKSNFKDVARATLADFAASTSLHGIKRIVDDINYLDKSSSREKLTKRGILVAKCASFIFWGGSFIMGIVLLVYLNNLVWNRKERTPTLTTIDTYYHPIYNVPFPAITLCSINVVYRSALQPFINKLKKFGFTESEIIETARHFRVYTKPKHEKWPERSGQILRTLRAMYYRVDNVSFDLMHPCKSMVKKCFWMDELLPCEELFLVTKTPEGFCCSFNNKWAMLRLTDSPPKTHEYRLTGAGENVGLDVLLDPEPHQYLSYQKGYYGITVLIHTRENYADSGYSFTALPGYTLSAYIIPSVVRSDQNVRLLAPSQRNCLFVDEKKLLLHSRYSYASCMTDCRVQGYIEHCGCIPFFYPHTDSPKFQHVDQCNFAHVECMREIRAIISSTEPPEGSSAFEHAVNKTHMGLDCDCLPACDEVRFDAHVVVANRLTTPLDDRPQALTTKFNIRADEMLNYSILTVSFEDSSCIKYRRSIYMTWDNLLSSFGGIFGLCLGGSLISFIEIAHFLLFRTIGKSLLHDIKQKQQKKPKPTPKVFTITNNF